MVQSVGQVADNLANDINTTRENAKRTIAKLIEVHRQTIADIEQGKKFWKRGEDVSDNIRKRCKMEISACEHVLDALDDMKAGDIQRAAALCAQISEHLPRV